MPLLAGTRVGPYEILAPIGAGGMGEVYRAKDTKLDRQVAIKVLPPTFANDAERMARFEREAKVLASLNHPNIAHIYGVEDRALAMELVEGESPQGPLPFEEAWKVALQIADALEYAHDKGVVHRDLKPANVLVTPNGVVKLLDFGLAKAYSGQSESGAADPSMSPTLTIGATVAGTIMGTAAYMAPEQAKGKQVDKRADIWSWGVVLHELLTGERLFQGEDVADTLAQVLTKQPDLEKVPVQARRLLAECLTKDPRKRLRDIGDAKRLLEVEIAAEVPRQAEAGPGKRPWISWAISTVLFLALAVSLAWIFRPSPPLAITRFPFTLGEGQTIASRNLALAISPEGAQMVYVANRRLFLRSMAELEGRPIPGTESNSGVLSPAFSPDGKSLAFWEVSDNTLRRIAVSGGAAVTICPVSNPVGVSWSEEGILFGESGKSILRVSPNGGKPEPVVTAKDNELIGDPQMLPGGQAVLFVIADIGTGKVQVAVQTLKTGARKVVLESNSAARYLPTGHLVYLLNGVLFVVPFDVNRLETTGGPVGMVEGVARSSTSFEAHIAFSSTGSLIYIPGPVSATGGVRNVLGLVDRKGEIEPLKVPPGVYRFPRVSKGSPGDNKRVAYQVDDGKDASIWIWELSGATAPRRLTLPGSGANRYPIWTSDSQRIAFQSDREGDLGIWWQRSDGTGAAERLTKPDKGASHIPESWAPDGQTFSFTEEKNNTAEVWTYSLRDKKATVLAATPGASLNRSVFSPDGRWVAYQLSAQPNSRIYVRPFPRTETEFVAPVDGDTHHPLWSPDGKELFYVGGPGISGSMSVTTQPSVSFGTPARAPRSGFTTGVPASVRTYDILPDGKHFLGVVPAGQTQAGSAAGPQQIQVVLNWFEDVKQRAPGR